MSHNTYNKQWHEAQQNLQDILAYETVPEKPEKNHIAAFQLLSTMYIKYIQIFRKLEQCYDQLVHPQKRKVIKKVLDGVIGRIIEIKNEMVNLELSEYHYFDDILSDLKLTPQDIEIPIPKYFVLERKKILNEREKLLGQILAKSQLDKTKEKSDMKMPLDEAIRMIQIHERARQGRLRAKLMQGIRLQEDKERNIHVKTSQTMDFNEAALKIQRMWRGILSRRYVKKIKEEEFVWLGMTTPVVTNASFKSVQLQRALKIESDRRIKQAMFEQEYNQALVTIKDKIRETEGPDMKESMKDQISQWIISSRYETGKFPDYPEEEDGGSLTLFKEKTPEEIAAEILQKESGEDNNKKKGKSKDDKNKSGKEKKGKDKKDDEEEEGWKMSESNFLPLIKEGDQNYTSVWKNRNEENNFTQGHDSEIIKEEKRPEVEAEIRIQVDELMRQELENLRMLVDKEKAKRINKKKKKGKKSKKGKKGKKEKDLTPERTIESLYEELVVQGIIKKNLPTQLSEYEGEYNYLATTLRQRDIEPQPSLSDVRRLVTEFCILPMGSPEVREKAPLIKSVLLTGPRGVGKTMLVHAVCSELGANLFDLTASNLEGKYPGKDGLKMLLHMIFKVGRLLQPSILLVDQCEKMFKKKIPKTDLSDPKRLKKDLPKLVKGIKPEDRIMLIGTSSAPFDAELKPFCSLYQKLILIPRPDYASRNIIWRKLILRHNGILTNQLDISSLTKISDGYTMSDLNLVTQQVLTERRIAQLSKKPLQANEFISHMARIDPVYMEEEEAFQEWYKKTPLGKKRIKAQEELKEAANNNKGKGKNKNQKGKK